MKDECCQIGWICTQLICGTWEGKGLGIHDITQGGWQGWISTHGRRRKDCATAAMTCYFIGNDGIDGGQTRDDRSMEGT
jgi:hypothetical protein